MQRLRLYLLRAQRFLFLKCEHDIGFRPFLKSKFEAPLILFVVFISHLVIRELFKTYLVHFVPETLNNFQLNWLTILATPSSVACGIWGDEVLTFVAFIQRRCPKGQREKLLWILLDEICQPGIYLGPHLSATKVLVAEVPWCVCVYTCVHACVCLCACMHAQVQTQE